MKTYVLILSREFPATHKRKGEPTQFIPKIRKLLEGDFVDKNKFHGVENMKPKYHTIRGNYNLWRNRFNKIEAGEACLSLRYWMYKPYRSEQVEFARLTKEDGIGIQRLEFRNNNINEPIIKDLDNQSYFFPDLTKLAKNDGLALEDWLEWFKNYDLSEQLAIIHFTRFRY